MRAVFFNSSTTIILLIWVKRDIWTFKCEPLCVLNRCCFMTIYRCSYDLFHMDEDISCLTRSTLEIKKILRLNCYIFVLAQNVLVVTSLSVKHFLQIFWHVLPSECLAVDVKNILKHDLLFLP